MVLYTNESATNVVNKTINTVETVQGYLRQGTSIIDPVIMVEDTDFQNKNVNYAQIQVFGRYYYITNIASVYNNLWEIHCHVDVLMSFADGIKAQTAVVARQERTYNLMLDDGFFMAYQNPRLQTKTFSNATPFEHQEFVLVVAGS